MKIELKGRVMPRDEKGDVRFKTLGTTLGTRDQQPETAVSSVFSDEEVVELVNRAIYQLEYQRESHRKRGEVERAKVRAVKAALKAQRKEPREGG